MFGDLVQRRRVTAGGQGPARRSAFRRTHAIIRGTLSFEEHLPADLRHGLLERFGTPGRPAGTGSVKTNVR